MMNSAFDANVDINFNSATPFTVRWASVTVEEGTYPVLLDPQPKSAYNLFSKSGFNYFVC